MSRKHKKNRSGEEWLKVIAGLALALAATGNHVRHAPGITPGRAYNVTTLGRAVRDQPIGVGTAGSGRPILDLLCRDYRLSARKAITTEIGQSAARERLAADGLVLPEQSDLLMTTHLVAIVIASAKSI